MLISVSGIVLTSLRLFEIGICNNCCFKNNGDGQIERLHNEDSFLDNTIDRINSKTIVNDPFSSKISTVNLRIEKQDSYSEELQKEKNDFFMSKAHGVMNNLSFSAMLVKSFLLENMFYIMQGIHEIAKSMYYSKQEIT